MDRNEIVLKVIEAVKANPCLYDPKEPSFRDRTKKREIWESIGEDLHISSIDAKTYWERLRRKYITRRSNNLPADTRFDKLLSFIEGCCGLQQTQNRSAMKPQLPASTSTNAMVPTTSAVTDANNGNSEITSNSGPSTSAAATTTPPIADNISSSTSREDTAQHWLGLLFAEFSQKARKLPIGKQLDIAKQVGKICEEATKETAEANEADAVERSYFT